MVAAISITRSNEYMGFEGHFWSFSLTSIFVMVQGNHLSNEFSVTRMAFFYQRKKIERKYLLYIHEVSVKNCPYLLILSDFKIANLKMLSVIVWLRICTKFTGCQYIILIFHCSWFQVTIHLLLVVHCRESFNVS